MAKHFIRASRQFIRKLIAPVAVDPFIVIIAEDKFSKYLKTNKLGKLKNAGLADLTKEELEEAIRFKMRSNYLYNISWRDEPNYQGSFFNIMLEFAREGGYPERMTVALEYMPSDKILRLVTVT